MTTDPTSWIRNSVVWYSQQVTRHVGERRFHQYVSSFRYGNQDLSGDPGQHNGLTNAWLSSSLQISPMEQIDFLERLVQRNLGVSARAYEMTGRITTVEPHPSGWVVHGKTGTGFPVDAKGESDEEHAYGWFVGWASNGPELIVFVRLIQDDHAQTEPAGMRARDALLNDWAKLVAEREPSS
jgi:beta-lactamase class D